MASRSGALEERIKKLEADLTKATLENRAQSDLEEVATSIEEALAGLDAAFERTSLTSELQSLSTRWNGYAERVTDIEEALGERVGELSAELTAMQDAGELWKRTEANARDAKAPQAVRSRISETRELLRSTEASITQQRNAALELQSRAAKLLESIAPVKERIGKTSEALAAGLLVRQDEPLWRAWPGWDQFAEDRRAVVDGIAHLIEEL
ncbi:MAG: hypothetical protein JRG85_01455, partial [Deltaproteobacteria bacterium]|nr:hypothetical protein [Deltaproteobacteria bacterium]